MLWAVLSSVGGMSGILVNPIFNFSVKLDYVNYAFVSGLNIGNTFNLE